MAKMFDATRKSEAPAQPLSSASAEARHIEAGTRMAYMADLLLELKDMATCEGHATLAGLLALAHREALAKSR